MALLLAFDTATKHCAVVLAEDERILASRAVEGERFSHAEKLNVFIDEVMTGTGRELADLDALAVGMGPGSYTGLRIGLSAAKGLCFALDLPLIGLGTLNVLRHQLRSTSVDERPDDALHPMIDARRMEVFMASTEWNASTVGGSRAVILDDAWCRGLYGEGRHLVFGDGADKAAELWAGYPRIAHIAGVRPSAEGLALAAHSAFVRQDFADLAYLVPDYGKEANVTQPKRGLQ